MSGHQKNLQNIYSTNMKPTKPLKDGTFGSTTLTYVISIFYYVILGKCCSFVTYTLFLFMEVVNGLPLAYYLL